MWASPWRCTGSPGIATRSASRVRQPSPERPARPAPPASGATGARVGRRGALKTLGLGAFALASPHRAFALSVPEPDVLVLGAGFAGLAAARHLAEAGMRPLVLEARNRPGGRAHTRFDLPDRPEFGAVEVGNSYTRVRALAAACGLHIRPSATAGPRGLTLHVNGHTLHADDWPRSPANTLPEPERTVPPGRIEAHYLAKEIPLARAADWDAPAASPHDRSITAVLRQRGISAEGLRLANVAGNHNHSDRVSVLGWWRGALARRADTGAGQFVEGAGALARCLADELGDRVRYASAVTEIVQERETVRVRLADGGEHRAPQCICTLPLPALRNVALRLPVDPALRRAVDEVAYTRVCVALFDADPFWEDDGLPHAMWTDTPLERIFPRHHPETGACIGFKAFVNGAGAAALDRLDEAAFEQLALATFARIRPAAAGRVRYLARHAWGTDPFAGGAYAAWPPGKVAEYRAACARPAGGVRFAGEHVGQAPGMEGAIRSGERAAAAILKEWS